MGNISLRLLLQGPVGKDGRSTMGMFWVLYLRLREMFDCNACQPPLPIFFFFRNRDFSSENKRMTQFSVPSWKFLSYCISRFFAAISTKRKYLKFGPQKFCFCAGADDNRLATICFVIFTVQVGELWITTPHTLIFLNDTNLLIVLQWKNFVFRNMSYPSIKL